MDKLENITTILEIDERDRVLPSLRNIVKPRYLQLEGATDEGSQILRERMQRFLVVIARDPELRAPLAEKAAARIGLNGEPDKAAVPDGEMETAFSVGVQDLGEPFFDLLLSQGLASEDPAFRGAAFGALARVEDPKLVAKLQAAILDGKFSGNELTGLIYRQMARRATAELTYNWLIENDEAVIALIPESRRSGTLPTLGSFQCSVAKAEEWETFVNSHADKIPGYERDLAQATESIRLCAALNGAQGADLLATLEGYQ
jgi:alanyl aminopeptidase